MKLLILEDNPSLNEYLRSLFKTLIPQADILSAYSICDAARVGPITDFDLISLDLDLPDGSGLAFAQSLYKDLGPKMPKVLFITGNNNYEVAFKCYDSVKCIKYLSKPINLEDLQNALSGFLTTESATNPKFIFKTKQLYLRLEYSEILYFEKNTTHTSVVTIHDRFDLGRVSLKEILTEYDPSNQLIQIHKSFLVNTNHIEQVNFGSTQWQLSLKNQSVSLPVGRVYKSDLQHFMNQFGSERGHL